GAMPQVAKSGSMVQMSDGVLRRSDAAGSQVGEHGSNVGRGPSPERCRRQPGRGAWFKCRTGSFAGAMPQVARSGSMVQISDGVLRRSDAAGSQVGEHGSNVGRGPSPDDTAGSQVGELGSQVGAAL